MAKVGAATKRQNSKALILPISIIASLPRISRCCVF